MSVVPDKTSALARKEFAVADDFVTDPVPAMSDRGRIDPRAYSENIIAEDDTDYLRPTSRHRIGILAGRYDRLPAPVKSLLFVAAVVALIVAGFWVADADPAPVQTVHCDPGFALGSQPVKGRGPDC
jgi:hypothetical protein